MQSQSGDHMGTRKSGFSPGTISSKPLLKDDPTNGNPQHFQSNQTQPYAISRQGVSQRELGFLRILELDLHLQMLGDCAVMDYVLRSPTIR